MKKLLFLILLLPLTAKSQTHTFTAEDTANTFTGTNIFTSSLATALAQYTVGTLPNATTTSPTRELVIVTDGQNNADCTVGGGSSASLCRTNGTVWQSLGGLFGGSIANTQVGFGGGTNTFTGSNNLEYVPASGGVVITTNDAIGPTNVTGSGLAITNAGGGATAYMIKLADGTFILRNDSAATPAKGFFRWDGNGTMLLQGGSNTPQLTFYNGASVSPFGNNAAILNIFSTGGTPHVFAVTADQGAGDVGYISLNPFTDVITFGGDVSGSAAIGTATAAGTPNRINLPTITGTAGQVLKTDGSNPQQASWVTPFIGEYCGATSGATQACAKTQQTAPLIIHGDVTLNTATSQSITTLPFSDALYSCSGSDLTTAAGVVTFTTYASTSVTIVETGGNTTDHLRYICVGN